MLSSIQFVLILIAGLKPDRIPLRVPVLLITIAMLVSALPK